MSEKLHQASPEHHKSPEHHFEAGEHKRSHELREKANKAEHEPKDAIESIKKSIESSAISGKEYSVGERDKQAQTSYGITKQLKSDAYKRTLKKAQSQLSAPEKTFSKVIHTPVVEKTSDIAAKTVARPTGILFGAIGAFVGSVFVLFISKRSGFTFNYLFFLIIFVAGYFVGLTVELIVRLFKKPPRS